MHKIFANQLEYSIKQASSVSIEPQGKGWCTRDTSYTAFFQSCPALSGTHLSGAQQVPNNEEGPMELEWSLVDVEFLCCVLSFSQNEG